MTLYVKKSSDNTVEVRFESNKKHINNISNSGFKYFDLEKDELPTFVSDLEGIAKEEASKLHNSLGAALMTAKSKGFFLKPISDVVSIGTREYLMMDTDSNGNNHFYNDYEDSILRRLTTIPVGDEIGYVYSKEHSSSNKGYSYPLVEEKFKKYLDLLTAWYNETIYDVSLLKDGELLEKIEGVPLSDLNEMDSLLEVLLERSFSKDSEYSKVSSYADDTLDTPILV